jgi:Ca2+/Na+ antiporter
MAGLIISIATTFLMFTHPVFVTALGVCALLIAFCLIYFLVFGKSRVSPEAPEESFARHLQKSHSFDGQ